MSDDPIYVDFLLLWGWAAVVGQEELSPLAAQKW